MTEEERQDEIQKKLDKKLSDTRLRVLQIANTIIMKPEDAPQKLCFGGPPRGRRPSLRSKSQELSADRRSLAEASGYSGARRDPYTVETLAIELRHLAYQTRFFQKAMELSADRRSLAK